MDGSSRLMDCHPSCPYRPASWRWQRAGLLRTLGMPLDRRSDDPWVARAMRFQNALARARTDADRIRLAGEMPVPFAAYRLWSLGEHPWRWALEARVLAGEPPGEIAVRCGLELAAVEAYEALFFNVRDLLPSSDYIGLIVIGTAPFRGIHPGDTGTLWKWLAYRHGPLVLEEVITLGTPPVAERPARPEQVAAALAADSQFVMGIRRLVAALSIPVNEKTRVPLLRMFVQLEAAERRGRGRSRPDTAADADLSAHVRAMTEGLDRLLGKYDGPGIAPAVAGVGHPGGEDAGAAPRATTAGDDAPDEANAAASILQYPDPSPVRGRRRGAARPPRDPGRPRTSSRASGR